MRLAANLMVNILHDWAAGSDIGQNNLNFNSSIKKIYHLTDIDIVFLVYCNSSILLYVGYIRDKQFH